MATSDMSLGGGAGFGAGYTPIRFAPLVSLTGPVMAPATPAAPEAAAPMLRLPMMADQGGGYETPQRTDAAFQNLQPIGDRLETPEGRAAEFQNLSRAMTALMSPMTTIPSLALTGKTPMELMAQAMGMGGRQAVQGTPAAPFGGFLQGLQNFLFGPSVSLGGSSAGGLASQGLGMGSAVFNDAMNAAMSGGASAEMADAAGRAAFGLVAQGMDPASAVALASMTALGQVGPEMPAGMGGMSPTPGAPAFTGIETMPMDIFGNPYSSMAGTAPVAPQVAQTFGLRQPGNIESSTQIGGMGGADSPFGGFTGGDWGPGDTPGGYDTNTGAYSDSTGFE
jgi:hypothetical protein